MFDMRLNQTDPKILFIQQEPEIWQVVLYGLKPNFSNPFLLSFHFLSYSLCGRPDWQNPQDDKFFFFLVNTSYWLLLELAELKIPNDFMLYSLHNGLALLTGLLTKQMWCFGGCSIHGDGWLSICCNVEWVGECG